MATQALLFVQDGSEAASAARDALARAAKDYVGQVVAAVVVAGTNQQIFGYFGVDVDDTPCMYVSLCVCVCVRACVFVRERERLPDPFGSTGVGTTSMYTNEGP